MLHSGDLGGCYPLSHFAIQTQKAMKDTTKKMNLYSFGDFNLKITHKLNEKTAFMQIYMPVKIV